MSAAVARATWAGVLNEVVLGAPPRGGRPGRATVTRTLRNECQAVAVCEVPPQAASARPASNARARTLTLRIIARAAVVNENRPHFGGRLPIQVWPNRDGQGYVPERAD